ncbi:uncharacterized protein LOC107708692 [Tachysurus ichikawai]
MDIITAQCLVVRTEEGLRKCARDFKGVKCSADEFGKWANGKVQDEEECELVVQAALSERSQLGEKGQISARQAVDHLIDYHKSCWSLEEHLNTDERQQPYLLASGTSRRVIDNFYITTVYGIDVGTNKETPKVKELRVKLLNDV